MNDFSKPDISTGFFALPLGHGGRGRALAPLRYFSKRDFQALFAKEPTNEKFDENVFSTNRPSKVRDALSGDVLGGEQERFAGSSSIVVLNQRTIERLVKTSAKTKHAHAARGNDVVALRRSKRSLENLSLTLRTDVKAIREKLGLNQGEFATTFGIPLATLQNWEQGRRKPDVAVCVLLHLIASDPKGVASEINRIKASEPA